MWDTIVFSEFARRTREVYAGGGETRMEKQRAAGKMTARERLDLLLDAGSFQEFDMFMESRGSDFGESRARFPGDGVVCGYGRIDGRGVIVSSQDFTVFGGAGGEVYTRKLCTALEKAMDMGLPYININDSGGARIGEGVSALGGYSRLFYLNTQASGRIPQIALIMGNCAGGASYSPALCDFVLMVEGTSQMYITGPRVLKTVTGEDISMEALGGPQVHSRKTGQAHFVYENDAAALMGLRRLMGYLPQSFQGEAPHVQAKQAPEAALTEIVPYNKRKGYDVRALIEALADGDSFLEVQKDFAENIVVGFVRMAGESVAVVANQPCVLGGALTCDAADKAARFIRFCDCFSIPILTLVDVPAFLPGVAQEHAGILRHGSKLLYAYSEATTPKIALIVRKAYGGAYCAMNSKPMGADMCYAWPIAEIAVMGAEGAVDVLCKREIEAAAEPEAARAQLNLAYKQAFLTPYFAASRGFVDEVILPQDTRAKLLASFRMLREKRQNLTCKKHGNIPL